MVDLRPPGAPQSFFQKKKKRYVRITLHLDLYLEHLFAPPAYGGNHLAVLVLGHQAPHVLLLPQPLRSFAHLINQ